MTNLKRALALVLGPALLLAYAAPACAQNGEAYSTPPGGRVPAVLVDCLNGSNQAVPCSATVPLNVNGTMTGASAEVCVTPTVTASLAYTSGNVVGGLITFANLLRTVQTGVLQSIRLTVLGTQTAEFDVTFFSSNPQATTWTDRTAPAIAAGDKPFAQPVIKLTNNFSGLGTHTVYGADNISRSIKMASTSGYAVITVVGTPTFASTSDVQLCAAAIQD